MRVYLAGYASRTVARQAARDARAPLLVSYFEVATQATLVPALAGWPMRCFLDSGAFSAASIGASIDLGAFADFYLGRAAMFDTVSNLDVIGDARASERNLVALRARGVPALAVWHLSSSMGELDRVCREHERFAIGGMVPYATKPGIRDAVLRRAWDVIFKHWPRRVHGFGLTGPRLLEAHPWHTVDSTAALKLGVFGRVLNDEGRTAKVNAPRCDRLEANARSMLLIGERVTREWAAKGIVWND